MIIAITGPPGSGKSYALVARAYKALKQGRPVYANFPILGCYEFTMGDLINCSFPEGSVIIVDEAGRWFNSQDWSQLQREVYDLFTMHRHLGYDMYVGVQAFNRIDKSLREVIELTYVSHKQLFWHLYRGFYEVERVGRMKGTEDVSYIVPKRRKYRNMYNTFGMKSAFNGKPLIENKLYAPLPPTFIQRLKTKFISLFKKEQPLLLSQKEVLTDDERLALEHGYESLEEFNEWVNELPYLESIEIKNGVKKGAPHA